MNPRLLKAPAANGGVLAVPDFAAVPALVASNRRLLDERFRDLRQQARRDLGIADDAPILLTGHQPELFHPGVWVKNFALCGLARKLGGHGVNLIADTDTLKSASIRFPVTGNGDARLTPFAFDDSHGEEPYETRRILNPEQFASFSQRLAANAACCGWPWEPMAVRHALSTRSGFVGRAFTDVRRSVEELWGCSNREVTVHAMAQHESFRNFVGLIAHGADRFRECYNAAIQQYRRINKLRSKHHPAAELDAGELPFWTLRDGRRQRTFQIEDIAAIRPKALTLTLFARLILGDFFLHGLGGGKYDAVTDTIIRTYFNIQPPAYQVLTATLHLPFDGDDRTPADLRKLQRRERDLTWSPHQFAGLPDALRQHRDIVDAPTASRRDRRDRFRRFRELRESLRPAVAEERAGTALLRAELERDLQDEAIVHRRDFSWVLHPESTLKPFLRRFLDL